MHIIVVPYNLNQFAPKEGLDYLINSYKKVNENTVVVEFTTSQKEWKKIDISYIITSRNDIIIGTFLYDDFTKIKDNTAVVTAQIDKAL